MSSRGWGAAPRAWRRVRRARPLRVVGPNAVRSYRARWWPVLLSQLRSPLLLLFTPGARTNWHSHAVGQTLHVTDGIGLVQTRDGKTIRMRPTTPSTPHPARNTGTAPPPATSCATSPCSRASPGRRDHLARTGHRRAAPGRHPAIARATRLPQTPRRHTVATHITPRPRVMNRPPVPAAEPGISRLTFAGDRASSAGPQNTTSQNPPNTATAPIRS
jgi:hypothetical protein